MREDNPMTEATQISATISTETRELLERFVAEHGVKKSRWIETAVLHHLNALDAIPADLVIPPIIHVSSTTGKLLQDRIENPKLATPAMRELYEA